MREVAVQTPLRHRCVFDGSSERGVGVAPEAQIPQRLLEDLPVVGAVRGVAA
jgi:hypothetical protein